MGGGVTEERLMREEAMLLATMALVSELRA